MSNLTIRFRQHRLTSLVLIFLSVFSVFTPSQARFLSGDPVQFSEDQPQMFNRYSYTLNDPVNMHDPDGEQAIPSRFSPLHGIAQNIGNPNSTQSKIMAVTPVVGDIQAIGSAISDPSTANIAAAAVGVVPVAGDLAGPAIKGAAKGTDFAVTPKGEAISVPDGASGPNPTINKGGNEVGFEFTGGSGGKGMDSRVDGVRVMDANQHQGPRAVFMNENRQTVDPSTGRTVSNSDPKAHHQLKEDEL